MVKLNIFSIADEGYWKYIPTFALSALMYNENCHCEIMVKGYEEWASNNRHIKDTLQRYSNITIRPVNKFWYDRFQGRISDWVRFVEVPEVKADYTYICDIDFVFVKGILEDHLPLFDKTGLCYTNIIRPYIKELGDRLTGCYMVKTKEWYDSIMPMVEHFKESPVSFGYPVGDEVLLFKLVDKSTLSLPDRKYGPEYRPVNVVHCSPNRSVLGWGIEDWKMPNLRKVYQELVKLGIEAPHLEKIWIEKSK